MAQEMEERRLQVEKIGLLTTGLGRAYEAEAKLRADAWVFQFE